MNKCIINIDINIQLKEIVKTILVCSFFVCFCFFDGIIKIEDFNLDNILTDEKSCENSLV